MKKLMIAALLIFASSAAFAGDSDALKAILKAKTYTEAEGLLKSNLAQLTTAAEKAKAYNKLVDLAMAKVSKEQAVLNANQMATQFNQGKVEPYDTLGMYSAVYDALKAGIECDKYDQMPNEKGAVKPKFHSANQARLNAIRVHLINAGQAAAQKEDKVGALRNYGMYVESASSTLMKDLDKTKNPDQYLGEVARVASVFAYQNNKLELADQYVDIALQDTAVYKEALNLKLYIAQQQLKTKEDSVKYADKLKDIYTKDKTNDQIFGQLASLYASLKMLDAANSLISDKLSADPKNYTAWALKGQNEMNTSKWDDAVSSYKKAIEIKNDEPILYTYLGYCINSKAGAINNDIKAQKALYQESLPYLEKAKQLDPNRDKANWSYPLYQCYYVLYGANDARTKEIESMIKQ